MPYKPSHKLKGIDGVKHVPLNIAFGDLAFHSNMIGKFSYNIGSFRLLFQVIVKSFRQHAFQANKAFELWERRKYLSVYNFCSYEDPHR